MPTWQQKLKSCFGVSDRKFGLHSADEERGKQLKVELDGKGVTWTEAEKEIRQNILNGCLPERNLRTQNGCSCFGGNGSNG